MLNSITILYSLTDFSAATRANMYIGAICIVQLLLYEMTFRKKIMFFNAHEKMTQQNGGAHDR